MNNCNCKHAKEMVFLKEVFLSDGRRTMSEHCTFCFEEVWKFVPLISDMEKNSGSIKYEGKKLGEVPESYLMWIIKESKASDTLKKAATRIFNKNPWIVQPLGEWYDWDKSYACFMEKWNKDHNHL